MKRFLSDDMLGWLDAIGSGLLFLLIFAALYMYLSTV